MKDLAKRIMNEDKRLQYFKLTLRGGQGHKHGAKVEGQLVEIHAQRVVINVKHRYNQSDIDVRFDNVLTIRQ